MEAAQNYIGGKRSDPGGEELDPVVNPASGEAWASCRASSDQQVAQAASCAEDAFKKCWRATAPLERARLLMGLKEQIVTNRDRIARILTREHGKTLAESEMELTRAIENIEVASGVCSLMMGRYLEDAAAGIDEYTIRQPLGVFVTLCPFNFPAMIPFWFLPYALATGNCMIVKPSPRVPLTMQEIFKLIDQVGFPAGVVQMVQGAGRTAKALITQKAVKGISFVGSTPVGKQVYKLAGEHGKRVQVQAGAKNFAVMLPDADLDRSCENMVASAFDCTGQRCLALSAVLIQREVYQQACQKLVQVAKARKVGFGLDEGVEMGPVISRAAQEKIEGYIDHGVREGAKLLLDGRGLKVKGYPNGYWLGPTIFGDCRADMKIVQDEIFGPVLCLLAVDGLDDALEIIHKSKYGNAASIFTNSGAAARKFRYEVGCGNLGINIGVAAPMAFFHFSGLKDSFFGDLHAQGRDGFQFFTEAVVVVERWHDK